MSDHDHYDHDHEHPNDPPAGAGPNAVEDAGSQALADALRSSFAIVKLVMIVLVVIFLGSGIFAVQQNQRAIRLRFGKPVGEGEKALLGPGLHWAFPYPIDEVVTVPITDIQQVKSTVGWFAITPEQELNNQEPMAGPSLNPALDGYTITGDGNIIHTRATLSYRISEPVQYALGFVNASNALQNALDNALIYASAQYAVDDVLTRDKTGFRERVQARVERLIKTNDLGIEIEQCVVESRPPRQCKQAFDSVLQAMSARDTAHNDAVKYENQILNQAAAEAASRTNLAEVESARLESSVKAEAQRLTDLLPGYRANQALFSSILLNETITQIMTNAQDIFYIPESPGGGKSELRLQLNRQPAKSGTMSAPSR